MAERRPTVWAVTPMPKPGDVSRGFIAEAEPMLAAWSTNRTFKPTHCAESPGVDRPLALASR